MLAGEGCEVGWGHLCRYTVERIERAFIDFLGLLCARQRAKEDAESDRKADAEVWLLPLQKGVDDQTEKVGRLNKKTHQRAFQEANKELEQRQSKLDAHRAIIVEIDTTKAYSENFSPALAAPSWLNDRKALLYAEKWKNQNVKDERVLAFIASDFRSFWMAHGSIYTSKHEAQRAQAKELTATRSNAGTEGAIQKNFKKWTTLTRHFKNWLGDRSMTEELIEAYPKQPSHTKDRVKKFLGTLLAASQHESARREMVQLLENQGFKSLGVGTPSACFSILSPEKVAVE